MTGTQWLLLILVVAAVVGAYFYLRSRAGDDPWRGMDEAGGADEFDRGESLGGDSYIVGVRSASQPAEASRPPQAPPVDDPPPAAADPPAPAADAEPEPAVQPAADVDGDQASWRAFTPDQAPPEAPDTSETVRPRRPPAGEERLFILHVASRDQRFFDGPAIHEALQAQKLKFGLNSIYHRITETNGVPESVFGVANMLKPGYLDPVEQDHLQTPGLTLFLQLPGPIEGSAAVRDLLESASGLAEALGAEVLDERHSLLKPQMAQYMLDEVAEIDRKQRLASQR